MIVKKIKTAKLLTLFSAVIASAVIITQLDKDTKEFKQASTEPSVMNGQLNQNILEVNSDKQEATKAVLGFNSQYGKLPHSLAGTLLDSKLETDEDGHLKISDDIKYVFDYFLSTITEENLDTILLRVNEYLEYYLEEPALSESKVILAQYIDLKSSLVDLEQQMGEQLSQTTKENRAEGQYLELLRTQLSQRNTLRAQHLDPEIYSVFYADEEAYDEYTYSRLLINSDSSISSEERNQKISELQQVLPEDVRQAMQESQITDVLKSKTEKLISEGGSQQQVRDMRKDMFGEEAAKRLDELDQQRAQWKARVDGYLTQRTKILNTKGLAQKELQFQVNALRESNFDTREQVRVKNIERRAEV